MPDDALQADEEIAQPAGTADRTVITEADATPPATTAAGEATVSSK